MIRPRETTFVVVMPMQSGPIVQLDTIPPTRLDRPSNLCGYPILEECACDVCDPRLPVSGAPELEFRAAV